MKLQVDGHTARVELCQGGELCGQIDLPGDHACDAYAPTLEQLEVELRTSLRILLQDAERGRVGG